MDIADRNRPFVDNSPKGQLSSSLPKIDMIMPTTQCIFRHGLICRSLGNPQSMHEIHFRFTAKALLPRTSSLPSTWPPSSVQRFPFACSFAIALLLLGTVLAKAVGRGQKRLRQPHSLSQNELCVTIPWSSWMVIWSHAGRLATDVSLRDIELGAVCAVSPVNTMCRQSLVVE